MIEALLTLVVIAGTLSFVIDPLLKKSGLYSRLNEDTERKNLEQEKFNIYAQIKEADFEYEMGKLSYRDYRLQRKELMEKAAEVLEEIEKQLDTGNPLTSSENLTQCPDCGSQVTQDSKYCGVCGTKLTRLGTCSNCQNQNPPDSKFCWHCGQGLVAA